MGNYFEKQSTASQPSREINVDGMIYNSGRAVLAFQCRLWTVALGLFGVFQILLQGFCSLPGAPDDACTCCPCC